MDYPKSVPSVGLVGGKFADEDSLAGTPGSLIPAQWGNGVTDEILNVITTAGLTPDEAVNTQLATAISQFIGKRAAVVGSARKVRMSVSSASATASLTAEEVVVKSALGGQTWLVSSFNKSVNLASIGAGGMDTGAAPVSGYVALYVIFNPTTSAAALLAVNATLAAQPTTYAGVNMPAGYTASALVSVWGVTGSQFRVGEQVDREIFTPSISVLSTSSTSNTLIPLSVAAAAPLNSRKISGSYTAAVSANGFNGTISGAASGVGSQNFICNFSGTGGTVFRGLPVLTAQTIYYSITTAGTLTNFVINITCYEI